MQNSTLRFVLFAAAALFAAPRVSAQTFNRAFTVTPVPGFFIAGGIPNATYVTSESLVYLVYALPQGSSLGICQATSADGVTFSGTGTGNTELSRMLSSIGKTGVDIILREITPGTKRYFATIAGPFPTARMLYRADKVGTGALTLTTTPCYTPGTSEGNGIGVMDIIPTTDGKMRLFYNALSSVVTTRENVRTIISSDNGASWAIENPSPFGDYGLTPSAQNTNADPAPLRLSDGTYMAVTMRGAILYFWNSSDGVTWTQVSNFSIASSFFSATAPLATGLYDPTIVQLPNGKIYLYVTAGATNPTDGGIVAAEITPTSSRLTNLSVLSSLSSRTDSFSLGYVVSGASATAPKPLVIRAAGPSLGALGFPGTLDDPKLETYAGSTKSGENEDWGGSSATTTAMAAVGAFAYSSATSRDAALTANITSSDNSVKITTGAASVTASGAVIAEVYDATPSGSVTPTTARLVNFSVIKQIAAGGSLTLGFTIGGTGTKTVLIRVIGPGLAAVGLTSGTLADPQLTLYNSTSTVIDSNNDWAATATLIAAGTSVNAFSIGTVATKDAMLLKTLSPGGYTATATGNASSSGLAIVEVYEVP